MCSVSLNPLVINNAWKQLQSQLSLEGVGMLAVTHLVVRLTKLGFKAPPSSVVPNTQVVPLSRTL